MSIFFLCMLFSLFPSVCLYMYTKHFLFYFMSMLRILFPSGWDKHMSWICIREITAKINKYLKLDPKSMLTYLRKISVLLLFLVSFNHPLWLEFQEQCLSLNLLSKINYFFIISILNRSLFSISCQILSNPISFLIITILHVLYFTIQEYLFLKFLRNKTFVYFLAIHAIFLFV